LLGRGGVFTTTVESGQQWDYPNAWAPLVALLVEGLDARGSQCEEAIALATRLRQQWLRTCYEAWRETGYMYEKYNATAQGQGGGGGEYVPQVGFGWTNGVALSFLARERS
jgi:alpha,alpha-trehalase